jgi:hypothetical protein
MFIQPWELSAPIPEPTYACTDEFSIQTAVMARLRRVSLLNAQCGIVQSPIGTGDECKFVSFRLRAELPAVDAPHWMKLCI